MLDAKVYAFNKNHLQYSKPMVNQIKGGELVW